MQVMRSKLAAQPTSEHCVPATSSAEMLSRCHGMFAGSVHEVHAAMQELHSLHRFIRFRATRQDVAWASSGELGVLCTLSTFMPHEVETLQFIAAWIMAALRFDCFSQFKLVSFMFVNAFCANKTQVPIRAHANKTCLTAETVAKGFKACAYCIHTRQHQYSIFSL